jgi:hypothetical protein
MSKQSLTPRDCVARFRTGSLSDLLPPRGVTPFRYPDVKIVLMIGPGQITFRNLSHGRKPSECARQRRVNLAQFCEPLDNPSPSRR